MRTNLVLDDVLMREARRYSRATTKKGLVEEALRTFVEVRAAEERRTAYAERLKLVTGRLQGLRLRERPSDLLRADRERG